MFQLDEFIKFGVRPTFLRKQGEAIPLNQEDIAYIDQEFKNFTAGLHARVKHYINTNSHKCTLSLESYIIDHIHISAR